MVSVNVIKTAVSARWQIIEVGDWEAEALSLLMITFLRNGFQVLERDNSELQEVHVLLKGTGEGFTIVRVFFVCLFFSKCSKKGRSGACCQVLARTN